MVNKLREDLQKAKVENMKSLDPFSKVLFYSVKVRNKIKMKILVFRKASKY